MPDVTIKVEGIPQLRRALLALGVDIEDLKDAFARIAGEGARIAAGFAPVRTGRLAGSIRGNRSKSKATITAGRAAVPYAGAINYGWPRRNIAASRFMQRADRVIEPRAIPMLEADMNAAIRRRGLD
jgi:hypothetical protein